MDMTLLGKKRNRKSKTLSYDKSQLFFKRLRRDRFMIVVKESLRTMRKRNELWVFNRNAMDDKIFNDFYNSYKNSNQNSDQLLILEKYHNSYLKKSAELYYNEEKNRLFSNNNLLQFHRPLPLNYFNWIDKNILRRLIKQNLSQSISAKFLVNEYNKVIENDNQNDDLNIESLNFLKPRLTKHNIYKNLKKMNYGYRFPQLKSVKLETYEYKLYSKILIKAYIEIISLKYNIIYVDESKLYAKNKHFRTWTINTNKSLNLQPVDCISTNLLIAVDANSVIHYETINSNIDSEKFIQFMINFKRKLSPEKFINSVIFLDNAKIHTSKLTKKYFRNENYKILYGSPYKCEFNFAEFTFMTIKKEIYKENFKNMYLFKYIFLFFRLILVDYLHNTIRAFNQIKVNNLFRFYLDGFKNQIYMNDRDLKE